MRCIRCLRCVCSTSFCNLRRRSRCDTCGASASTANARAGIRREPQGIFFRYRSWYDSTICAVCTPCRGLYTPHGPAGIVHTQCAATRAARKRCMRHLSKRCLRHLRHLVRVCAGQMRMWRTWCCNGVVRLVSCLLILFIDQSSQSAHTQHNSVTASPDAQQVQTATPPSGFCQSYRAPTRRRPLTFTLKKKEKTLHYTLRYQPNTPTYQPHILYFKTIPNESNTLSIFQIL